MQLRHLKSHPLVSALKVLNIALTQEQLVHPDSDTAKAWRLLVPHLTPAILATMAAREILRESEADEDLFDGGELALAGSAYAFVMAARQQNHLGAQPAWWPWVNGWEPSTNHEDISKALGYLVAELERLHRAEGKGSKPLVLVPG